MKLKMRMEIILEDKQKVTFMILKGLSKLHMCEIEQYYAIDNKCYFTISGERRVMGLIAKITNQGYDTVKVVSFRY